MDYDRKKRRYENNDKEKSSSRESRTKRRRLYSEERGHRNWRSSPCKGKYLESEIKKVGYRVEILEDKISELHYSVKQIQKILDRLEELAKPKKGERCMLM